MQGPVTAPCLWTFSEHDTQNVSHICWNDFTCPCGHLKYSTPPNPKKKVKRIWTFNAFVSSLPKLANQMSSWPVEPVGSRTWLPIGPMMTRAKSHWRVEREKPLWCVQSVSGKQRVSSTFNLRGSNVRHCCPACQKQCKKRKFRPVKSPTGKKCLLPTNHPLQTHRRCRISTTENVSRLW